MLSYLQPSIHICPIFMGIAPIPALNLPVLKVLAKESSTKYYLLQNYQSRHLNN